MILLAIDDEKSVHVFLDRCVGELALPITRIIHAYKGSEALEKINSESPDLILLDIQMPGMNGIEFLQALKNQHVDIPVIVLTAYSNFDYAKSCIKYGVTNYLLKPIDLNELHDALADAIHTIQHRSEELLKGQLVQYITAFFPENEIYLPDSIFDSNKFIGVVCYYSGDKIDYNNYQGILCSIRVDVNNCSFDLVTFENRFVWNDLGKLMGSCSIRIGLSDMLCSGDDISVAVKEAYYALKETFYCGGAVYYVENCFSPIEKIADELRKDEEELFESYREQNLNDIRRYVSMIFSCFSKNCINPDEVKGYLISLLGRLDSNYWKACKLIQNDNLMHDFQAKSSDDLQAVILRIIISMLANIYPEHIRTDEDIIYEIKKYIDRHYNADLSLASMENHFYISRYQVSRLFKERFECNYSNYILQVRMDAAKTYLLHSGKKLSEISQLVGYEDVSYFSNVFKKYYGISPSDFRCKYQNYEKNDKDV